MRQSSCSAKHRQSIQICTTPVPQHGRLNLDSALLIPCASLLTVSRTINFLFKVLSSFPHGTCSLSVSCQYLALEGVYLPFWAAFPSNPTHRKRIVNSTLCHVRDCHPLRCAVPSNLSTMYPSWKRFSRLQFAVASNRDFKFELIPLHSPLLGESLLVSFPPLINMLKFSG